MSPEGGSTLTTSAPKSERITAAAGAATKVEKSTTLSPEKMLSLAIWSLLNCRVCFSDPGTAGRASRGKRLPPSTCPDCRVNSQGRSRYPLHLGVVRTASALRSGPCDVAGGILDVAGLAMDAVLRIDDELEVGTLADPLVDAGRTIPV